MHQTNKQAEPPQKQTGKVYKGYEEAVFGDDDPHCDCKGAHEDYLTIETLTDVVYDETTDSLVSVKPA